MELDNCLITPHNAGGSAAVMRLLAQRVRDNVARFAAGEPLLGEVDLDAGYCTPPMHPSSADVPRRPGPRRRSTPTGRAPPGG